MEYGRPSWQYRTGVLSVGGQSARFYLGRCFHKQVLVAAT